MHIGFLDDFRAVLAKPQHNFVEDFVGRRRDLDAGVALIDAVLADLDFADLEVAALGQDLVEHLRQDQRIDNVAAQDDGFGKHRPGTYLSPAAPPNPVTFAYPVRE